MGRITNIWSLPTGLQTLREISQDLSQGLSLCLIVATLGAISDLEKALQYELEVREGLNTCSVRLNEMGDVNIANLQRALTGSDANATSLEQVIRDDSTPEVVIFQGFEETGSAQQQDAIALLKRWAEYCHTNSESKSLCLIVPGNAVTSTLNSKASTTRMKVRCLMGIPSALEVQLLCRTQSGEEWLTAETRWREMIVSSLAGNDLELAYFLLQNELNDFDDIVNVLKDFVELQLWQRPALEKHLEGWTPISRGIKAEIPRHQLKMKLLRMQATVYTPEYGEEIHSAVLAMMGKQDEVKRRIWRSQMALVLPIIDELRTRLYLLLEKRVQFDQDQGEIPEISELKYTFDRLPPNSSERLQFYNMVRHARNLRNKLAHLKLISFDEYINLWQSWQRLNQMRIAN